ncbi:MAG: 6-carboxytetrahydropterin synthase [Myxococcales bacterium]|jgi:6-pyruvoyl-tetrahydropterin synthase
MYSVRRSIDIDFAHHVRGHRGACINLHGHTWKFEVVVAADALDAQGFVVDFSLLGRRVLRPCHDLLDHSLAVGEETFGEIREQLAGVGERLLSSRDVCHVDEEDDGVRELAGARLERPGGMKVAVFPFSPTSERIARWLYDLAHAALADERVRIDTARIYETLHPVESVAEYRP